MKFVLSANNICCVIEKPVASLMQDTEKLQTSGKLQTSTDVLARLRELSVFFSGDLIHEGPHYICLVAWHSMGITTISRTENRRLSKRAARN